MAYLKVGTENNADIELWYEDRGTGAPVVLIHGWPLNGASWERQVFALLAAGYRVITYDRRGFGKSSHPGEGYDYDTLARDLNTLLERLDLRDVALVGFSMGGGEVARYMGKFNTGRVSRICFVSSIAPALRKDGNNPDGVDPSVFEGIKQQIEADRFAFLDEFGKNFYNHGLLSHPGSSDGLLHHFSRTGSQSFYLAMLACVDAWLEDFRADLGRVQVPTLVIHGDADKVVPAEHSGARVKQFIRHAQTHLIEGGPHGVNWTHANAVNKLLLDFVGGR